MAKAKNTLNRISIGGTDYGQGATGTNDIAASVLIDEGAAELDGTVQGNSFQQPFVGIGQGTVQVNLKVNTDMGPLVTLNGLHGTEVTVLWKLDGSAATSSTNQEATIKFFMTQKFPFGGEPGSAFETSITCPMTAAVTWATS